MTFSGRIAYGSLGAPLAMAALPVYVYIPKLYGDNFGLGLSITGAVLLLSRIIDTAQDPWLGRLSDYLQSRQGGWKKLVTTSAFFLGLAFIALFNPPDLSQPALMVWLGLCLIIVYTAHSALNITYLAWGARASDEPHERTRIVASREGFGLLGVVLASVLPTVFIHWLEYSGAWLLFSLIFALILFLTAWQLHQVPLPTRLNGPPVRLFQPLEYSPFRKLIILFFLNGLSIAIAATLALFYIADVLGLETYSGGLLALYFVSGAVSLPFWLNLSRRIGKPNAWLAGSVIAVFGFVWAIQLGSGDLWPFIIVCILSGAALGSDLALPAAIAADIIPQEDKHRTAGYFGIWSLINKGVLAIAAGTALPLLSSLGYKPGEENGLLALAIFYAGIPCLIKLFSAGLIIKWRSTLEVNHAV